MKITKRQLRRIIREAIDFTADYEPANVDKIAEIIQPLFAEWNVGFDRQGEIAMEVARSYDAAVDNPDKIYAHARDLLKSSEGMYLMHDEYEDDWDEYPEQAKASREAAWEERMH